MDLRITRDCCSGCDVAIMESSADEQRLLTRGDFQTCRLWKMWSSFGDSAAVVASCIATNELRRVRGVTKQSDRHASHLRMDQLRRFIFSASLCPRLRAFTGALVALRIREIRRREFNRSCAVRAITLPDSN